MVLFDEIVPTTVAAQRKLFQAAPAEIQFGCSSTNVYSYTVCLYKIKLILCTNTWNSAIQQLPHADAEWLQANSVHVHVDRPLWQQS